MIKRLESPPCEERQNQLGLFCLEKTLGRPYQSSPALKGLLQRRSLFSRTHMEKTSGNEYKLLKERFHLYMKNSFYAENSHSQEQAPQGTRQSWRFSRCHWTGYYIISSRLPSPWKTGLDVLRSPPAWAILWFSDYFWEVLIYFFFLPRSFFHLVWTDCCGRKYLGWGRQIWN